MTDAPQPPREAAFFTTIRGWGLTRGDNGLVGGVVEGLGQRIGMAAVPARLLTVLAALLLPGVILLAYAASWGLLPDRRGNIIIQNFGRGVTNVGALLGIAVLTLFGFGGFDSGGLLFGTFGWGGDPFIWDNLGDGTFSPFRTVLAVVAVLIPLAVLAGVIVLIVWLVRRSKNPPPPPTHAPGAGPMPPAAPAQDGADAPAQPSADAPPTAAHATTAPAVASAPASGTPQPWEPALLPGDPRAGVAPSRGALAGSGPTMPPPPPTPGAPAPDGAAASAPVTPAPYAPYAPPAPPAPPIARVPGPGKGGYVGFLGVLVLSAAIVVGMDRADELAVSPVLAWGACITIGLGAVIVIVAITGRKLGFLGFLSVVAVLLSLLFAGNAKEIRERYDASWTWAGDIDVTVNNGSEPAPEPSPVETPIDLTGELAPTYGTIYAAGSCTTPVTMETWEDVSLWGDDTATMRLDAVDEDVTIDIDASYTHVAVPAGTSIEIFGVGSTTVIWEDRDISCFDWSEPDAYDDFDNAVASDPARVLSATNADSPVLTLNGRDGSVIYLEEVTS